MNKTYIVVLGYCYEKMYHDVHHGTWYDVGNYSFYTHGMIFTIKDKTHQMTHETRTTNSFYTDDK